MRVSVLVVRRRATVRLTKTDVVGVAVARGNAPARALGATARRVVVRILPAVPPLVVETRPVRVGANRVKAVQVGAGVAVGVDVVFVVGTATLTEPACGRARAQFVERRLFSPC